MKKILLSIILILLLTGCVNNRKTIYFEDAKKKELSSNEVQKDSLIKFAEQLNQRDLKLQFKGTSNIIFQGQNLKFTSETFLDGQKVNSILVNGKKRLYWFEESNKYFYISKDEKEWFKLPESTFTESLIDSKIFFPYLTNFKSDIEKENSFEYMGIVLEENTWTHKFKINYVDRIGYYFLFINIDNLMPLKIEINTPSNVASMRIYNENTSLTVPTGAKELDSLNSVGKVSEIVLDFLETN